MVGPTLRPGVCRGAGGSWKARSDETRKHTSAESVFELGRAGSPSPRARWGTLPAQSTAPQETHDHFGSRPQLVLNTKNIPHVGHLCSQEAAATPPKVPSLPSPPVPEDPCLELPALIASGWALSGGRAGRGPGSPGVLDAEGGSWAGRPWPSRKQDISWPGGQG